MADATYPLPLPSLRLTIGGENRTVYLVSRSLQITQQLGAQAGTCRFTIFQPTTWNATTIKPTEGQEVLVEVDYGGAGYSTLFGGYILRIPEERIANRTIQWSVQCSDYTVLLSRRLVLGIYRGRLTDIIKQLIRQYAPRIRYTAASLQDSTRETLGITFNYRYPRDCFDELAGLIGYEWYVDAAKTLWFYESGSLTRQSPNSITDTSKNFMNLLIEPQLDQVRNRIWVQGGDVLSDYVVETFVANGTRDTFRLAQGSIESITIDVDGMGRAIGVEGISNADGVEFLVLTTDSGRGVVTYTDNTAPLADNASVVFRYRYRFPASVVVEDLESQALVAQLSCDFDAIALGLDDAGSTGPVAFWHFAETGGAALASDASGNAHTGIYTNFAATDQGAAGMVLGDPANTAVYFDGSNNYVTVSHHADLNLSNGSFGNAWAIICWVKVNPSDYVPPNNQPRALLDKGHKYEVRINYYDFGAVSLHSDDYLAFNTPLVDYPNLSGSGANNTAMYPPPDGLWHLIIYAYVQDPTVNDGNGLYGYLDGDRQFFRQGNLRLNNSADTTALLIGVRDTVPSYPFLGYLDEVMLFSLVDLTDQAARRLWEAAQEDGVREVLISQGDIAHVDEARAYGNLELARWSRVITQITFDSMVGGWTVGDYVTVNVTQTNVGRAYSGSALIQSVDIQSLGAQRLGYRVQCMNSRFNAIDFYRQLLRQDTLIPGKDGQPLAIIQATDDNYGAIVVDAAPVVTHT